MTDDPNKNITTKFEEIGIEVIGFKFSFWDLELRTKRVAHIIGSSVINFITIGLYRVRSMLATNS